MKTRNCTCVQKKKITQVKDYHSIKSLSWKKWKAEKGKKKEKGWNQ